MPRDIESVDSQDKSSSTARMFLHKLDDCDDMTVALSSSVCHSDNSVTSEFIISATDGNVTIDIDSYTENDMSDMLDKLDRFERFIKLHCTNIRAHVLAMQTAKFDSLTTAKEE